MVIVVSTFTFTLSFYLNGLKKSNPEVKMLTNMDEIGASIFLVTWNRVRMLKEGISSIIENTDDVNYELIVWDNNSQDGTFEYLVGVARKYPQVKVIRSPVNISLNAWAEMLKFASGFYIITMDDDVIQVPEGWLKNMIDVFNKVPNAGYLATNVIQNTYTDGFKPPDDWFKAVKYGDEVIEEGFAPGWCAITTKEVIEKVGGFPVNLDELYTPTDGRFNDRCKTHGYRVGIIQRICVYHATGPILSAKYGYLEQDIKKYDKMSKGRMRILSVRVANKYRRYLERIKKGELPTL